MFIRKIPHYDLSAYPTVPLDNADFLQGMFCLLLPPLPAFDEEKCLLSIPGALEIRVIRRSYDDVTPDMVSIKKEGCFLFNTEDEWMLEANCTMRTNDGGTQDTFTIRLPLSAPFAKASALGFCYDGTWLRFMRDGEVLNENSGFDRFCTPTGAITVDPAFAGIEVAVLGAPVSPVYREEVSAVSPDFYFPYGWNTNVGDVMTFSHDGTYHLIYLLDRRHHKSRNGAGAHSISHFTSSNLIDWSEQEPIAEITAPWMTYGTGTMLFNHGKYYMSYGLHTERYAGAEPKITAPFDEETQTFSPLTFDEVFAQGGVPAGAAYSVSDDGMHFTPGNVLYHTGRNPSAYTNEAGGVTVYSGYMGSGVWESAAFGQPFGRTAGSFPFTGVSPMRNSSECPAFFTWNGYRYLLVGFTGYYRTVIPDSTDFIDAGAVLNETIYAGLSVPMVAELPGGRRVMAGWVQSAKLGWGGVLMQRELLQEEGGRLGMRWLPEITPKPIETHPLCSKCLMQDGIALEREESYLLEAVITPNGANLLALNLSDGRSACVLQLDLAQKRATVNDAGIDAFGEPRATMLEVMQALDPEERSFRKAVNVPHHAHNFGLPDIRGIDSPFTLRVIIRRSRRLMAAVLDAEIAGRRTLVSVRPDFHPTRAILLADGPLAVTDAAISRIPCAEF